MYIYYSFSSSVHIVLFLLNIILQMFWYLFLIPTIYIYYVMSQTLGKNLQLLF